MNKIIKLLCIGFTVLFIIASIQQILKFFSVNKTCSLENDYCVSFDFDYQIVKHFVDGKNKVNYTKITKIRTKKDNYNKLINTIKDYKDSNDQTFRLTDKSELLNHNLSTKNELSFIDKDEIEGNSSIHYLYITDEQFVIFNEKFFKMSTTKFISIDIIAYNDYITVYLSCFT